MQPGSFLCRQSSNPSFKMKRLICLFATVSLLGLTACQSKKTLAPIHSAEGGPIKGDGRKGGTFIPRQDR